MEKRFGERIVTEHGLLNNFISGLQLVDQLKIANVSKRAYEIVVPWNIWCLSISRITESTFPKIHNFTDELVYGIVDATVEG